MVAQRSRLRLLPNVQGARRGHLRIVAVLSVGVAMGTVIVAVALFVSQRQRGTAVVRQANQTALGAPIVHFRLDSDGRDEFGHVSLEPLPADEGGGPVFEAGAARFGCSAPNCTGPALLASPGDSRLRLGRDFTISTWVRVDGQQQSDFAMIFTNGQMKLYMTRRGQLAAAAYGSNGNRSAFVFSRGSIERGAWHHVAVTQRGSAFRLWLDGTSMVAHTSTELRPPDQAVYLGRDIVHSPWPGMIDDVTIWDRELSSRELSLLTR